MKVAVLKERAEGETRVAVSPETVKKLISLGLSLSVERGAGTGARIPDDHYAEAGATLADTLAECLRDARLVLAVRMPEPSVRKDLPAGATLIGMLDPHRNRDTLTELARAHIDAFSLELLPHTSD